MTSGIDLIIIIPIEFIIPTRDTIADQINVEFLLFILPLVNADINTIALMNYKNNRYQKYHKTKLYLHENLD